MLLTMLQTCLNDTKSYFFSSLKAANKCAAAVDNSGRAQLKKPVYQMLRFIPI